MKVLAKLLIGISLGSSLGQTACSAQTDKEIVALVILGEARGEGKAGMYAIACVIKQRMIENKRTARKVCLREDQFVTPNSKHLKSTSATYALKLAEAICTGKDLDRKFVGYANHFCTLDTFPDWGKGRKPVKIIKNHKFFKL
jgi:spore germination cell wall hydrolase CwlJ-like protein